jgi:hypothetical protein
VPRTGAQPFTAPGAASTTPAHEAVTGCRHTTGDDQIAHRRTDRRSRKEAGCGTEKEVGALVVVT